MPSHASSTTSPTAASSFRQGIRKKIRAPEIIRRATVPPSLRASAAALRATTTIIGQKARRRASRRAAGRMLAGRYSKTSGTS